MKTILFTLLAMIANASTSFAGTLITCEGQTAKGHTLTLNIHYNNDTDVPAKEVFNAEARMDNKPFAKFTINNIVSTNNKKKIAGFTNSTVTGAKRGKGFKTVIPNSYFRFGKPDGWKTVIEFSADYETFKTKSAVCNAALDFAIDGIKL